MQSTIITTLLVAIVAGTPVPSSVPSGVSPAQAQAASAVQTLKPARQLQRRGRGRQPNYYDSDASSSGSSDDESSTDDEQPR